MGAPTLKEAQEIIQAAFEKAQQLGIKVSIAVVDGNGHLIQASRMDGAVWISPDAAIGKAFTAAAFQRDTDVTAERLGGNLAYAVSVIETSQGKITPSAGGFVIKEGDEVIGGIGVSGGPREKDHECAGAGLERFRSLRKNN